MCFAVVTVMQLPLFTIDHLRLSVSFITHGSGASISNNHMSKHVGGLLRCTRQTEYMVQEVEKFCQSGRLSG